MQNDVQIPAIFDVQPGVSSAQFGCEPSLRQMVRFYYGQHGQTDPDADTEQYFAALNTAPRTPETGEAVADEARAREAEPFLAQLRRVNLARYEAWVEGADAGIMFDALELGGEVGELLNVVKKLEREDRGWRGSRADPADFIDECADVLICLDKLARRRGVDLEAATIAKFNATSEKVGLPHMLAFARDPSTLDGGGGGIAPDAPECRTSCADPRWCTDANACWRTNEFRDGAIQPRLATPPAHPVGREAGDYEKAYFERGMFAAYAWMVTKRRSEKLSDAVVDHAWDHRDEGMGPTECLPVLALTPPAPDVRALREALARALYLRRNPSDYSCNDAYQWQIVQGLDLSDYYADADAIVDLVIAERNARGDMEWFSGQRRLSLSFYSPMYGDDDDQSQEWRVEKETGPINDREWDLVGRGETATAAVSAARSALARGEKA